MGRPLYGNPHYTRPPLPPPPSRSQSTNPPTGVDTTAIERRTARARASRASADTAPENTRTSSSTDIRVADQLSDLDESTATSFNRAVAILDNAYLRLQNLRARLRSLPLASIPMDDQPGVSPPRTEGPSTPATSQTSSQTIGPSHAAIVLAGPATDADRGPETPAATDVVPAPAMRDLVSTLPTELRADLLRASSTSRPSAPATTINPESLIVSPSDIASLTTPHGLLELMGLNREVGGERVDNSATTRVPSQSIPVSPPSRSSFPRSDALAELIELTREVNRDRSDDSATSRGRRVAVVEAIRRRRRQNGLDTNDDRTPANTTPPPPRPSDIRALFSRAEEMANDIDATITRLGTQIPSDAPAATPSTSTTTNPAGSRAAQYGHTGENEIRRRRRLALEQTREARVQTLRRVMPRTMLDAAYQRQLSRPLDVGGGDERRGRAGAEVGTDGSRRREGDELIAERDRTLYRLRGIVPPSLREGESANGEGLPTWTPPAMSPPWIRSPTPTVPSQEGVSESGPGVAATAPASTSSAATTAATTNSAARATGPYSFDPSGPPRAWGPPAGYEPPRPSFVFFPEPVSLDRSEAEPALSSSGGGVSEFGEDDWDVSPAWEIVYSNERAREEPAPSTQPQQPIQDTTERMMERLRAFGPPFDTLGGDEDEVAVQVREALREEAEAEADRMRAANERAWRGSQEDVSVHALRRAHLRYERQYERSLDAGPPSGVTAGTVNLDGLPPVIPLSVSEPMRVDLAAPSASTVGRWRASGSSSVLGRWHAMDEDAPPSAAQLDPSLVPPFVQSDPMFRFRGDDEIPGLESTRPRFLPPSPEPITILPPASSRPGPAEVEAAARDSHEIMLRIWASSRRSMSPGQLARRRRLTREAGRRQREDGEEEGEHQQRESGLFYGSCRPYELDPLPMPVSAMVAHAHDGRRQRRGDGPPPLKLARTATFAGR